MGVYEHDKYLPSLPLPPLEETAEELKKRVRPITKDSDYFEFCTELEGFCAGEGAKLHGQLITWRESLPHNSSWLRQFWDDSYLSARGSLPRNTNYTLQLRGEDWGSNVLPRFTAALAQCVRRIRHEDVPPEKSKAYSSMDTMGALFYTRIPAPLRETWYYARLTDPMTAAVVCRGHWFILSLTDDGGNILSPEALGRAYSQIRERAAVLPPSVPVSAFTCAERDEALELRSALSVNMLNRLSLESIEKAAFVVCLEGDAPGDGGFARSLLCGDAANRFFDKSIQLISSGDRLGASLEHSGCDGMMWSYVLGLASQYLSDDDADCASPEKHAHIRLLDWSVPEDSAARLRALCDAHKLWSSSLLFDQKRISILNKTDLKQLGCSPDAILQLLFQLSYHRLTGEFRSIYEAVSAREFYAGRTECVHSCTAASVEFIRSFETGEPAELLREKLLAAAAAHVGNMERSKAGLSCERHMSGLQAMHELYSPESPLPALFSSAGYCALTHNYVSTSSIVGSAVDYFAFVPVAPDGMGLGYSLCYDGLHIALTSYAESCAPPEEFIRILERDGAELLKLLG